VNKSSSVNISEKFPLLIKYLLKRIGETSGQIKISTLADETGYTERYIQKVFSDFIGISPKLFGRVVRFQKSLDYILRKSGSNLSQMAYDLGYYDYAHFLHEFKEFSLYTPKQIMEIRSGSIKNKNIYKS